MKLIPSVITMCMLVGSSVVFAEAGSAAGAGGADAAPTPQLMKQMGKPDIAGDGINNATQVEDPDDIGRSGDGTVTSDSPEPLPVEGSAGVQEAK